MTYLINIWWRLVFWWKKQTGWIDLHEEIEIEGIVAELIQPDIDGDHTFNVRLDPQFIHFITGFAGRLTAENSLLGPSLHCEIPPWSSTTLFSEFDSMKVGDRVRVKGSWGFDGVHLGTIMVFEVLAALLRHQPNVRDGWFEIHPVSELTVL